MLRKRVVRLRRRGRASREVAEITGMTPTAVARVWRLFREGGQEAIKIRPGRRVGEKRRLTLEREKSPRRLMTDQTPEQLRFKFFLWTRKAVPALTMRECGVDLPLRTISGCLKRWGFSVQIPAVRAYERDPQRGDVGLTGEELPAIRERVGEEGENSTGAAKPGWRLLIMLGAGTPRKTRVRCWPTPGIQGRRE